MEASQQQPKQKQVALSEVEIKDENIALNVMVAMLNMAQKRGTFSMEESSKCWECIRKFVRPQQNPPEQPGAQPGAQPVAQPGAQPGAQENQPENISMETTENDGSNAF